MNIEYLRVFNILLGLISCIILVSALAIPRWKTWTVSIRLGWMSLILMCFTGTYGSLEALYLKTYFRVPMVTLALLWAIISSFWPRDDRNLRGEKE